MKRYITIGLTLCCCILLSAQDKKPWPLRVLHSIKTYIDSSAVRGIDPNYIKVPEKPWAVMLRYKANDMDLRSTSTIDHEMMAEKGLYGELNWESAFKPSSEVSIGAWIGYRGYGLGYAYNWVPMKNLLINITAMPMLVVYNRTKAYLYESNYDIFLGEGEVSPTGKKYVPDDDSWQDDITLEETSSITKYGKLSLNIDARASITYNFDRFFLNVYGQVNHWNNKIDNNRIKLTDWYVNASLGFRF